MYVPSYLEYLDRSGTVDGWPKFVTDDAKKFAVEMVRRGFAKFGNYMTLDLASECIFKDAVREKGETRPECLKLGLWDAIYAVTYRALLASDAAPTWQASSMQRAANLLNAQAAAK